MPRLAPAGGPQRPTPATRAGRVRRRARRPARPGRDSTRTTSTERPGNGSGSPPLGAPPRPAQHPRPSSRAPTRAPRSSSNCLGRPPPRAPDVSRYCVARSRSLASTANVAALTTPEQAGQLTGGQRRGWCRSSCAAAGGHRPLWHRRRAAPPRGRAAGAVRRRGAAPARRRRSRRGSRRRWVGTEVDGQLEPPCPARRSSRVESGPRHRASRGAVRDVHVQTRSGARCRHRDRTALARDGRAHQTRAAPSTTTGRPGADQPRTVSRTARGRPGGPRTQRGRPHRARASRTPTGPPLTAPGGSDAASASTSLTLGTLGRPAPPACGPSTPRPGRRRAAIGSRTARPTERRRPLPRRAPLRRPGRPRCRPR